MKIRGKYIKINYQKKKVKAFIPEKMPYKDKIEIDEDILQAIAAACKTIGKLEGRVFALPDFEIMASMYIKREAVLSSQIEGTEASLEDILLKEKEIFRGNATDDERVTYNYVKAMNYGIEKIKKTDITLKLIKELHKILLMGTRGENKEPGMFRNRQNYLINAMNQITFVPPPASKIDDLMNNLVYYINDEKEKMIDIMKCSLIHYQFETIHPFLDGNGRIGRLLITLFLIKKGVLSSPILYMSVFFLKNRFAYYNALNKARKEGDFKEWIMFFMKGAVETGRDVYELSEKIVQLKNKTYKKVIESQERASKGINLAVDDIFKYPITSVNRISSATGLSYNAAKAIIEKMITLKILLPYDRKERDRNFVFKEYLDLLE